MVTDNAGKTVTNESPTLTNAKATIDVTRDGNTYTALKLFVKPTTKDELIDIVDAAIDTTNGEGDTANLNFVDTSLIKDMSEMFKDKNAFNGNISEWDTSKVTNMTYMFWNAKAFNQDISDWDTSNATSMGFMFSNAKAFNQNIGRWEIATGSTMNGMFIGATKFDQDLSGWNTAGVNNYNQIFKDSAMATKQCKWPAKFRTSNPTCTP